MDVEQAKVSSLEEVLTLVLGLQPVTGVPGRMVTPRAEPLATKVVVGASERDDGKEREQNKSQELHYLSGERLVRELRELGRGEKERKRDAASMRST
jgi:hypothetical protein